MLSVCYPKALAYVLRWEGGYTNHPRDPGGPTKYGITIHDVRLYVKRNANVNDVRNLSLSQAKHIYKTKYWNKVSGDQLPAGLDYAVFDYGVNSGIGRSNRILRRLVGLPTNSIKIDQSVIDAVNKRDPAKLINALVNEREAFLRRLRTFPTFGRGWMRRTRGVRREALAMRREFKAGAPAVTPFPQPGKPVDGADAKGRVALPEPGKKTATGGALASGGAVATWWDWVQAHPALTVVTVIAAIIATVTLIYGIRRAARYLNDRVPDDLEPVPEKPTRKPKRRKTVRRARKPKSKRAAK